MVTVGGACNFVPEGLHQLLNQFLTLATLTLGRGDVTKRLKLAAFPDALLAALPLLKDGQRFNDVSDVHGFVSE